MCRSGVHPFHGHRVAQLELWLLERLGSVGPFVISGLCRFGAIVAMPLAGSIVRLSAATTCANALIIAHAGVLSTRLSKACDTVFEQDEHGFVGVGIRCFPDAMTNAISEVVILIVDNF